MKLYVSSKTTGAIFTICGTRQAVDRASGAGRSSVIGRGARGCDLQFVGFGAVGVSGTERALKRSA